MMFELRTYRLKAGRLMAALHDQMEAILPLFREHGIELVGAWEVAVGVDLPAYMYLVRWPDLSRRETAWKAFYADKRWLEIRKQMAEKVGEDLLRSHDVMLLRSTDYSPLQ